VRRSRELRGLAKVEESMTTKQASEGVDARRAIVGWLVRTVLFVPFIAALIFWAAGTIRWLNGWVYVIGYLVVSVAAVFLTDPALLAERTKGRRVKGQKGWDKALLGLYGMMTPLVIPIVAGLDFRFGWRPEVAIWLQVVAFAVYALGWALHLWAMAANRYHALVVRIQADRGQTVVTGGPYRFVRHPTYVGGIVLTVAAALVLASVWALIPGVLGGLLLVIRTILEDKTLQRELDGYREYAARVHYRLLPGVW
jgi:protein-S-isoprenylcysteine O-methyltransferase Ste14